MYAIGRLGTLVFGRFDPEDADCRRAVAHTDIPILFIHGEADAACASPKRLLTIPGAGHAVSCYVDPAAYAEAVERFLHDCLTGTV